MMRAKDPGLNTTSPALPLGSDDVLVVFAPVLPHPTGIGGAKIESDPFEHFCKAIGAFHPKVRHVPYLPGKVDYTAYARFLEQGNVFIVVACEAKTMQSFANYNQAFFLGDEDAQSFNQGQIDFTGMVSRLRFGVHLGRDPDYDAPLVLVTIGDSSKLSKSEFDLTCIKATAHTDRASNCHLTSVANSLVTDDEKVIKSEPADEPGELAEVSGLDTQMEISLTLTGTA